MALLVEVEEPVGAEEGMAEAGERGLGWGGVMGFPGLAGSVGQATRLGEEGGLARGEGHGTIPLRRRGGRAVDEAPKTFDARLGMVACLAGDARGDVAGAFEDEGVVHEREGLRGHGGGRALSLIHI